jgi:hypothetical protein
MLKKLINITASLSFTIAGMVVVLITLSGDTRRIALISSVSALLVHYTYEILRRDND